LYIDQLNQSYDNPILRKLVALSKKRFERSSKGNNLKADSNSETNDKDYVFFILSKLSTQRTYWLVTSRNISAAMSSTASGLNASIDYCY
jgi:hypothetical protein